MASAEDQEAIAGTAPTDESWLFVEYAGAWGKEAVAESRLPEEVRDYLDSLAGVRVQLIRRYGRAKRPGVRLLRARLGEGSSVESATLDDVREILDAPAWTPYTAPLFLVCTNGGRDRCCTEIGRPIAAQLAARWPDETWETTHLGGHRFAGTLLALPSGITLGRLASDRAVAACEALLAGEHPIDCSRGRAGFPEAAQFAELHLRASLGLNRQHEVRFLEPTETEHGWVFEALGSETVTRYAVHVNAQPGQVRKQSCGLKPAKPTTEYAVTSVRPLGGTTR